MFRCFSGKRSNVRGDIAPRELESTSTETNAKVCGFINREVTKHASSANITAENGDNPFLDVACLKGGSFPNMFELFNDFVNGQSLDSTLNKQITTNPSDDDVKILAGFFGQICFEDPRKEDKVNRFMELAVAQYQLEYPTNSDKTSNGVSHGEEQSDTHHIPGPYEPSHQKDINSVVEGKHDYAGSYSQPAPSLSPLAKEILKTFRASEKASHDEKLMAIYAVNKLNAESGAEVVMKALFKKHYKNATEILQDAMIRACGSLNTDGTKKAASESFHQYAYEHSTSAQKDMFINSLKQQGTVKVGIKTTSGPTMAEALEILCKRISHDPDKPAESSRLYGALKRYTSDSRKSAGSQPADFFTEKMTKPWGPSDTYASMKLIHETNWRVEDKNAAYRAILGNKAHGGGVRSHEGKALLEEFNKYTDPDFTVEAPPSVYRG